ncbi:ribonuclease H-like domain-containing protein [Tanacetum coccineum]|uniref:Ribonuclease H-like domain-containing protein n=1 Tax=Tanacetum coccineum TaxID=301880 RepID=A0ABQ5D0M7_9ASTR
MYNTKDEIPPPPPSSSQTPTQQTPHTVSTIKLPILKKGEYDIWAIKMEHYLAYTDYPIWEVIQNGNGPVSITTNTQGQIKVLPPRTAEEILARERERKYRTTLLMALPEDHLAKFHKMTDAKEMWDAIKFRFGGNNESKKMQKYILKQQFKGFSVSNLEGLHKGYDRFQSLLSLLKIHGAGVSTEDANQKFLRSLPSAWSQVSLIMRTKPGVDSLSFDDLYNNLRVFENDVKGSTASSSSTQNVAFVSENTSSTNDVSTAYSVSNTSGQNSQYEQTSSYSLLANQSSCPQLDHEDLEQLDEFDLEEMDLKWQVAMISMRMKKFYKKTGRKLQFDAKEPVGFDKTKVECYNCHKTGHFARECRTKGNQDSRRRDAWNSGNKDGRRSGKQEDSKALVTIDGEGVDWTSHSEEEEDYALMACNSSGSDTEVTSCSNECKESYAKLKKLYDAQREQLSDASIEIKAYTQGLKKVEAQLVAHQQGQLWYEEKIRFMKIDLDDKADEQADILRGIVKQAKAKQPLDNTLEFACKHAKRIHELLVYVLDTCPTMNKPSKKLVAVTPMTKVKKVRFSKPLTSSSNIHKQVESSKTPDSNTPVLPSTGLKSSTSASRSQFTGNKKNDRISQTPSSNMKNKVVQIVLWYLDSKCSKHMTGNRSQLMNFVSEFMGTVRFVNDQIAKIIGYGDYQLGNIIILRNLEGVDLLSGSRDTNLYTISLDDILKTSPICLLSKASKTKSWLWHRRLSHLKFGTLNKLAKDSLARGIPKLKFKKDHLCSACALGKSKKSSHQPKAEDTNQEKLYLQHMDLCGLMRV